MSVYYSTLIGLSIKTLGQLRLNRLALKPMGRHGMLVSCEKQSTLDYSSLSLAYPVGHHDVNPGASRTIVHKVGK